MVDKAIELLRVCGVDDVEKIGKNYKMKCAVNVDKEPSCGLHEDGYFKCFSCGARGGSIEFIKCRMGVGTKAARRLLGDKGGLLADLDKLLNWESKKKGNRRIGKQLTIYNFPSGNMIELKGRYEEYVKSRGITQKQVERYKIRCAKKGRFRGRIVFPVYMGGKCWGVTARAVRVDIAPKWRHSGNFVKTRLLYGYDQFKMGVFGEAILVEGIMDYMRMKRAGIRGVLATFNASLSEAQVELIKALGVERLLIAHDMDRSGHKGYMDILKEYGEEFEVLRWLYNTTGDPGSMNPKALRERYGFDYFRKHIYDEHRKKLIEYKFDFPKI